MKKNKALVAEKPLVPHHCLVGGLPNFKLVVLPNFMLESHLSHPFLSTSQRIYRFSAQKDGMIDGLSQKDECLPRLATFPRFFSPCFLPQSSTFGPATKAEAPRRARVWAAGTLSAEAAGAKMGKKHRGFQWISLDFRQHVNNFCWDYGFESNFMWQITPETLSHPNFSRNGGLLFGFITLHNFMG